MSAFKSNNKNGPEFEWVEKIRKGDESAFRDLFKAYYQKLVIHAYRYIRDTHVAENVVEDVLLKIWNNRKKWHISSSVKAYLYQAVRNHSLNYLKRLKHEQDIIVNITLSVHSIETPEDRFIEEEMLEQIQQAISELPNRSRSVFIMSRYDDLKYSEIAEILDISVGTVETYMVRALRFLRKRLHDLLFIFLL